MHASVIVTTYNQPQWLERVIWGYAVQDHRDFELVVADDGSRQETAACIQRLRSATRLDIQHVWHEDRAFRKCEILNKAIVAAKYDYLVFTDGDCIPRRDFLATHTKLAAPGCMLSGGMVRLPMHVSRSISNADVTSGRATNPAWLKQRDFELGKARRRLGCGQWYGKLLDMLTTTKPTFNGHNTSVWRDDVLGVNGFDQRMKYGGLDRELGERLINAGVRPQQVRHRAACLHLDHSRSYIDHDALRFNQHIRSVTRKLGSTWTDYGIQQQLELTGWPEEVLPMPARETSALSRAA